MRQSYASEWHDISEINHDMQWMGSDTGDIKQLQPRTSRRVKVSAQESSDKIKLLSHRPWAVQNTTKKPTRLVDLPYLGYCNK